MDIKKTHVANEIIGFVKKNLDTQESIVKDSLKISEQAKILAEVNLYKNMILSQTPDVRVDRVVDARAKLENGYYSSNQVLDSVSRNLSTFLESGEEV